MFLKCCNTFVVYDDNMGAKKKVYRPEKQAAYKWSNLMCFWSLIYIFFVDVTDACLGSILLVKPDNYAD